MEDRGTPRMRKCEESKTTRIMLSTVPHVTSGSGLRKFQADGFLFDRVYWHLYTRTICELAPLEHAFDTATRLTFFEIAWKDG